MLSNIILRSTAAFGGSPFRLFKSTALGSAGLVLLEVPLLAVLLEPLLVVLLVLQVH